MIPSAGTARAERRQGVHRGGGGAEDRLFHRLLGSSERRAEVERVWTDLLRDLYPELGVTDLEADFLAPLRELARERVPLRRIPAALHIAPLDLPGWQALSAALLRVAEPGDRGVRERLLIGLAKSFISATDPAARPSEARRSQRPASLRLEIPSGLPEHWTERGGLVGSSAVLDEVVERCRLAARDRYPVLLLGETGAGKEVLARLIHELSGSADPFVAVNCAALPESLVESELFGHERGAFTGAGSQRDGFFREAAGGLLLLDEITEIPLQQQAKILRVLQDGLVRRVGSPRYEEIDVRVVATSNRDLEEALAEGHLRRDLYYRLAIHQIHAPALRDHREDIPELVAAFLARWQRRNPSLGAPVFTPGAIEALQERSWPGNVRELENMIYRLAGEYAGRTVEAPAIGGAEETRREPRPEGGPSGVGSLAALRDVEREAVVRALVSCRGNKAAAARTLGITRKTLYSKIRRYGIAG